MNDLYKTINDKTSGKYAAFRFPKVTLGDFATVTVVYPAENSEPTKVETDELYALVNEICGFNMPTNLELVCDTPTYRALRDNVIAFFKRFPYAASAAGGVFAAVSPKRTVKFKMHKSMYELAKDDFLPRLDEFLKNNYIEPVEVTVDVVEYSPNGAVDISAPQKTYSVRDLTPVIGRFDVSQAVSAASVSGYNKDIAVCGVLVMPTEFLSKADDFNGGSVPYERFLLYDGETTLLCRYYPRDGKSVVGAGLVNKPVCVFGNTKVRNGRVDEMTMDVKAIALCAADGLAVVPSSEAADAYVTVAPKPYEEYVQASLFESASKLPPALRGKFVAFDFETTGLSINYDKPTELGAVKIVDGVITETFSTLIDPQRPIPDEVVKKTGISDDMVKGQPLFEDVLSDFFKFTYGCGLIGHNIAFDFPFLIKYGNRYGVPFGDRATFDTMGLAPRVFPKIGQLTLDRVLDELGLVNDNAHRALSDATATAKAFIAMQKSLGGN